MHGRSALIRRVFGASFAVCLFGFGIEAQAIQGARFDRAPIRLGDSEVSTVRPVTAMDLLTLRDSKGLSISPDGKYVAFVVGQADYEINGYRSALFVASTTETPRVRSYGTAGAPCWDDINQWAVEDPKWSPDGQMIWHRVRMDDQKEWQVWGWSRVSGRRMQVTHLPGDVESYRLEPAVHGFFLTVNARRTAVESGPSFEPGVLFNGQFRTYQSIPILSQMRLAREPAREYWIHDFSTGRERRATGDEIRKWAQGASPEGAVLDKDKQRPLDQYHLEETLEAPDRVHVAYVYTVDDASLSPLWARRLLLGNRGTGELREVTPDAYFVEQLWWTADSATLYFSERDGKGHSPELRKVSADGSNLQTVFRAAGAQYFSAFSPDKSRRYFAGLLENSISPPQIALLDSTTGHVRKLVDLNPGFQNLTRSPAERIEGTNRYGEAWYGYLVKPLEYSPGTRYPLIVTTYRSGDYFLRGASGDQNPIQVYAAQGFAVLCFDTGRSRNIRAGNFEDKILDWSGPTASIEAAIDQLSERGVIDPERVGIAGFSHGEEIAGYAVLHTARFRAAIGAALYDPCFYFIGGSDWWSAFKNVGLGGWPEGNAKANWNEIDMPAHADRIHTAILENTSDTEFLIYLPLYRSLVDLGKPVELYIYPRELHVRNQPKHRLEVYERNLDWFRFWLRGEENSDPLKNEQYRRWNQLLFNSSMSRN